MSQIILDFGSGNTCRNDVGLVREMIDALAEVDTRKHECVIKWQLFESAPPNTPLSRDAFTDAAVYASGKGYRTTASVFDLGSLEFLLLHVIPFLKIACRPELYWFSSRVFEVKTYVSWPGVPVKRPLADVVLSCVKRYPATRDDYVKRFTPTELCTGISDHTVDWELFEDFHPAVYECHFKLPDSTGLDAGPFARTPEQLKEIL